jgi:hypothetical protein
MDVYLKKRGSTHKYVYLKKVSLSRSAIRYTCTSLYFGYVMIKDEVDIFMKVVISLFALIGINFVMLEMEFLLNY